jgi:uncharacterized protein (TIGR02246 family)
MANGLSYLPVYQRMRQFVAIGVALLVVSAPALAQHKPSAAMAQTVAVEKQIVDFFNKKDAAGLAAHFTTDGVFVGTDGKTTTGKAATEAAYAETFKAFGDFKYSAEVKAAHAIGNGFWMLVEASVEKKGPAGPISIRSHVVYVVVPAGKDWKIEMASIGANVPPGGPPQR